MRNTMTYTTFAAIDIGSHETTSKYEFQKDGIDLLDHVHHTSRLGYEIIFDAAYQLSLD